MTQAQSAYSDVLLERGTTINASYPGVQLLDDGFNVTMLGHNTITCRVYRNIAIHFGEITSTVNYYDGTVNFNGTNITLHSEGMMNYYTAAGIMGNNLTVNFADKSSGVESILFEVSNGSSGPGNYAVGIEAEGNLIVNGNFGGTISCVVDNRNFTEKRNGYLEGFYARGNLEFNGEMNGQIYLAGYTEKKKPSL